VYTEYRGETGERAFIIDPGKPVEIAGYDHMLRQQSLVKSPDNNEHGFDAEGISCQVGENLNTLTVRIGDARSGFETMEIDVGAFAEELLQESESPDVRVGKMAPESMAIVAEQNGHKVMVLFQRLLLIRRDGKITISSGIFDIAFTSGK